MNSQTEALTGSAHVRLEGPESVAFQQAVDRLHTSQSRVLRKLIRDFIGQGPDLLPQEMKVFEEAVYQLSAVGRNLNQLLRCIHRGQVQAGGIQPTVVEEVRDHVEALKTELAAVIDRTRQRSVALDR